MKAYEDAWQARCDDMEAHSHRYRIKPKPKAEPILERA